jgi:peroxiredoxin
LKRIWILIALLLILATAAGCKTYPGEGNRTSIKRGEYAPNFTLVNTAGEEVTLTNQRDKVVLINFWATWCPPCLQEMPDIQSRYEMHRDHFTVLAVNDGDSNQQVVAFRDEIGLTFEPLLDPSGSIASLYQVSAFPTSIFLDEHGIIQFIHIGLMTESQLDTYLVEMGIN